MKMLCFLSLVLGVLIKMMMAVVRIRIRCMCVFTCAHVCGNQA